MSEHRDREPTQPTTIQADDGRSAGRFSRSELAIFTSRLEALARSGQPLPEAVRALAVDAPNGTLRLAFKRLADDLESGVGLADSVGRLQEAIPDHLRSIIAAGERSGKLAQLLGRYLDQAAQEERSRSELRRALAYPIVIIVLVFPILFMIVGLTLSNAESLVNIFKDFGLKPLIPWNVYESVDAVARFFKEMFWPIVLSGPVLAAALAPAFLIRQTIDFAGKDRPKPANRRSGGSVFGSGRVLSPCRTAHGLQRRRSRGRRAGGGIDQRRSARQEFESRVANVGVRFDGGRRAGPPRSARQRLWSAVQMGGREQSTAWRWPWPRKCSEPAPAIRSHCPTRLFCSWLGWPSE